MSCDDMKGNLHVKSSCTIITSKFCPIFYPESQMPELKIIRPMFSLFVLHALLSVLIYFRKVNNFWPLKQSVRLGLSGVWQVVSETNFT